MKNNYTAMLARVDTASLARVSERVPTRFQTINTAAFIAAFFFLELQTAMAQTVDANKLENIHYSKNAANTVVTNEMMVNGMVVDSNDNAPMYGVNVLLKGSIDGTATDDTGRFIFPRNLKIDDVLVFSFMGYHPQEYIISERDRNGEIKVALVFGMDILGDAAEDGVYTRKHGIRSWFRKVRN